MRKKLLFVRQWRQWNRLVAKFNKVQQRLAVALDANEQNQLLNKLKTVFHQLEKMQSHTGIRLAGTALALVLTAATANAQEFKLKGDVKLYQTADLNIPGVTSMAFADLDMDGDQDLFVYVYDDETTNPAIVEYKNDGTGVFKKNGVLKDASNSNISCNYNGIITFGDIDKDNDLDLVITNSAWNSNKISIYKNEDGVFSSNPVVINHGFTAIETLNLADLDNDGDDDLVMEFYQYSYTEEPDPGWDPSISENPYMLRTPTGYSGILIMKNDQGIFPSDQTFTMPDPIAQLPIIDMADINGDNKVDFITHTIANPSYLIYYINDGEGNFTTANHLLVDNAQFIPRTGLSAIADVDDDGILDVCNLDGNKINLFKGTGTTAQFTSPEVLTKGLEPFSSEIIRFQFADLNADGINELYANHQSEIFIFEPNAAGDYVYQGNFFSNGSMITTNNGFQFAKIDELGDMNLYYGQINHNPYASPPISINNIFTHKLQTNEMSDDLLIEIPNSSTNFAFADIAGDGHADLFVGFYSGQDGKIKHYANDGNSFTDAGYLKDADDNDITGVLDFSAPSFADIDQDGQLELIVSGRPYDGDEHIKVYHLNIEKKWEFTGYLKADGQNIATSADTYTAFASDPMKCGVDLFVNSSFGFKQYHWTDITAPELTLPADATVKIEIGTLTYTVNGTEFDPLVATDNCDGLVVTNNFNNSSTLAGTILGLGTHSVTWTATDKTGNKTELSMSIEVKEKASSSSFAAGSPLSVLPNPTAGSVTVETGTDQPGTYGVESLSGTRLLNGTIENGRAHIDLSAMPNGIYLVRVTVNGDTQTVKIVKN